MQIISIPFADHQEIFSASPLFKQWNQIKSKIKTNAAIRP